MPNNLSKNISVPARRVEKPFNKQAPSPFADIVITGLHLKIKPLPL